MKLRFKTTGKIYNGEITSWLNRHPRHCEPTINVPGIGDLSESDCPAWEIIESTPTERAMLHGIGILSQDEQKATSDASLPPNLNTAIPKGQPGNNFAPQASQDVPFVILRDFKRN
ncbi:MAG: hypothetical protein WC975_06545 [Phycisphaerae bacterium]